jgi:hypothetical protein
VQPERLTFHMIPMDGFEHMLGHDDSCTCRPRLKCTPRTQQPYYRHRVQPLGNVRPIYRGELSAAS